MESIRIKCVGRRRLEVSYNEDANQYEIKILLELTGRDRYIATVVLEVEEYDKLRGYQWISV